MNYLTYRFQADENEDINELMTLNVEVTVNRDPIDKVEEDMRVLLDIWVSWVNQDGTREGKPELPSFNKSTAIALRDFLIFCFPLKPNDP